MAMSSAHLIYRAPEPDDLARLFAIYSDPQTQLFNPSGPMTDEAQAAAMLKGWIEHWQTHGFGWWAIARKEAPEHIIGFGGIGFHDFLGVQRVNLGYRFAVEAWGQGFATEMGRAALRVFKLEAGRGLRLRPAAPRGVDSRAGENRHAPLRRAR